MTYRALYHPLVQKEDLPHLDQKTKERIKKAIETRLLQDPLRYGKPLRYSLKSLRSLRVGDYRIIYKIETNAVIILKIGHRKEAYQKVLSRKNII